MCSCRKWQSPPGAWLSAALNHRAAQLLKGKTATARGEEIIRGHVWRRTCAHYLKSSLPGWSHLCGLLQRSIISGEQFLWQTGSVTKMCWSHLCSLCSVKALGSLTRSAERLADAPRKGGGYHSRIEGVLFQIDLFTLQPQNLKIYPNNNNKRPSKSHRNVSLKEPKAFCFLFVVRILLISHIWTFSGCMQIHSKKTSDIFWQ